MRSVFVRVRVRTVMLELMTSDRDNSHARRFILTLSGLNKKVEVTGGNVAKVFGATEAF